MWRCRGVVLDTYADGWVALGFFPFSFARGPTPTHASASASASAFVFVFSFSVLLLLLLLLLKYVDVKDVLGRRQRCLASAR